VAQALQREAVETDPGSVQMPEKLTQKRVDRLEPGAALTLHDAMLPGLLIRITRTRVTYAVQRPPLPGKPERAATRTTASSIAPAIGENRISLADARARARVWLRAAGLSRQSAQRQRREIPLHGIAVWGARVGVLESPVLRGLFLFGLYSGLRPALLLGIRRKWVDLKRKRIDFPAAVSQDPEGFSLPLSEELLLLAKRALETGGGVVSGTPWLFPAAGSKRGHVASLHARSLAPYVGEALRHTYERVAESIGVDAALIAGLLAQRRRGAQGAVPFSALSRAQRSISARITDLLGLGAESPPQAPGVAAEKRR
jgi:integrase